MYENNKQKVWKPRKWQSREELINLINEYLENTPFDEYSITWLALKLWTSRQLLIDYENREDYKDIIKEAKLIVEHSYEISLRKNWRTWDIFALKNFGWVDKSEVDQKLSWGLKLESKEIESLPQDQLNDFVKSKLN